MEVVVEEALFISIAMVTLLRDFGPFVTYFLPLQL
jgi:hypothetical protein